MKKLSAGLFLILFVSVFALKGFGQTVNPEHPKAKELVSLVREAVGLIEKEGEKAFDEFRKPDSKWFHGEIYIFVLDAEGHLYVNPAKPELQGTNVLGLKDEGGKPFVQEYVNLVNESESGEAWGHFQWYRPPVNTLEWKTAFVKKVKASSGKEYIVGSGLYGIKMEKMFVVDTVDNAARLISEKGEAANAIFNDKTSQYQYQDVYIFVIDQQGVQLAHSDPNMVGKNILDLQDKNGKPIVKDMLEMLQSKPSGWMDYWWPKPGESEPSKKSSYIKRVELNGEMLVVGAGVYLE